MSGSGHDRPAAPARRTIIGSLVGALAAGALIGLFIGIFSPQGPGTGVLVSAPGATATRTTDAAAPTAKASPKSSASPSKTKAKPVRTVTKSPDGAPGGYVQNPQNDPAMRLVVLESLDAGNRDRVIVYLRRTKVISGDEARRFYESRGLPSRGTAVVRDDRDRPFGLVVRRDSALWGQLVLGDRQNVNLRQLNFDEFLHVAGEALGRDDHPPLWIKRDLGVTGDIVYLAEHLPR